jgi:hypothetical protein
LPFIKGELEPSVSGPGHSENKESDQKHISNIWVYFLKRCKAHSLLKIVQHVPAIPPSNAFVERVFSVTQNIWNNERNLLKVEMVKAELLVHFNYNMKCNEFANFMKSDSGKNLPKLLKQRTNSKCDVSVA